MDNNKIPEKVQKVIDEMIEIQALYKHAFKAGVHFSEADLFGNNKPVLLKPGAELICRLRELYPDFYTEKKEENGHRSFVVKCTLVDPSGVPMGNAHGFASTMESKYRWRKQGRKCPACGKVGTIIKGKPEYGGGYICFGKKGGCGAKFPDSDTAITQQKEGKIENPDISDTVNTVLKMAEKRAFVAATLMVAGCSDIFTQDLDELSAKAQEVQKSVYRDKIRELKEEGLSQGVDIRTFDEWEELLHLSEAGFVDYEGWEQRVKEKIEAAKK